ncbi:unnamed protein product [Symbiodinium sp. CCMP2592]|nr:unnamed protein product [Symbiodinium sp. CCMP2592]
MDTVSRRRRAGGAGEPEAESAAFEAAYQAALGQAGVDGLQPTPGLKGEASPNTLEMGQGSGVTGAEPLLVAHPFHSERVQSEIQLLRNRPSSLDEDGQRLREGAEGRAIAFGGAAEDREDEQGAEPDYSAVFHVNEATGPRVARVETSGESRGPLSERSFPGTPVDSGRTRMATGHLVEEKPEPATLASGAGVSTTGDEELVPDSRGAGGMEAMLMQILEENRNLKRRLEQAEQRSHSSWHTGTTGEPAVAASSPMSFAAGGVRGSNAPYVNPAVGMGQPVQPPPSLEAMLGSSHFPASSVQGFELRAGQDCSAEPPNLPVSRPEGGASGLGGSIPGENACALALYEGPRPNPTLTGSIMGAEESGPQAQTMRQFTAQALEMSGGFHTPRSTGAGTSGFDANGYPLSPGGTVIRPPPLPPPTASAAGFPGAGLAPLAMIPRVNAQPDRALVSEGADWLAWVVAVLMIGVSVLWSGFLSSWFEGSLESALLSGFAELAVLDEAFVESFLTDAELGEPVLEAGAEDSSGSAREVIGGSQEGLAETCGEESADEFSEKEWLEAERKLAEAERSSGLTFVQRARVRKQVALGGLVEVPNFLQRRGPVPSWFSGVSPEGSEADEAPQPELFSAAVALLGTLSVHSERLCQFLGMQVGVWRALRWVSRAFGHNVVIAVLEQWSNTGVDCSLPGASELSFGMMVQPGFRLVWGLAN